MSDNIEVLVAGGGTVTFRTVEIDGVHYPIYKDTWTPARPVFTGEVASLPDPLPSTDEEVEDAITWSSPFSLKFRGNYSPVVLLQVTNFGQHPNTPTDNMDGTFTDDGHNKFVLFTQVSYDAGTSWYYLPNFRLELDEFTVDTNNTPNVVSRYENYPYMGSVPIVQMVRFGYLFLEGGPATDPADTITFNLTVLPGQETPNISDTPFGGSFGSPL